MTDWKVAAQQAVEQLQQWYGANPTGLYTWNGSDAEVTTETPLPTTSLDLGSLGKIDAPSLLRDVGLWDVLCATLRWWNSANAITALIDYMILTGDHSYLQPVVENTFANGPNTWRPQPNMDVGDWIKAGLDWVSASGEKAAGLSETPELDFIHDISVSNTNFLDDYYDDDGWWALAWIKAFDLTGEQKYLDQAETIFNEMELGWDTVCGGGIYWQQNKQDPHGKAPYKNAIANELYLAVSASLSKRLPLDDPNRGPYLGKANSCWNWFRGSTLINSGHLINDSFGATSTGYSCTNDESQGVWTYNQGVILGALCELYTVPQLTQDSTLLDEAVKIADALIAQPVGQQVEQQGTSNVSGVDAGILTEYTETSTYLSQNPPAGVDTKQFKGIFIRNLGYLYKLRPLARYRAFIVGNAESATNHDMNGSHQFGGNWSGPFDSADFVRQTAAVDLLNSANVIPPQVDYISLRQFLADSHVSLPTSLRPVLNGAGSLASVMHT